MRKARVKKLHTYSWDEIETWSGLGKSGAGETDGNGTQTGIAVLTSLLGNLPGTSRTAGFLIVGFSLPVSLPGNFPDCGLLKEMVSRSFLLPISLPGSSWTEAV